MSYFRVIPRDLFNEANLLKCLGALWIAFENKNSLTFEHSMEGEHFQVEQRTEDGSLYCANVTAWRKDGAQVHLYRPLNSRRSWPLYALCGWDGDPVDVFNDDGTISADFLALLDEQDL